MLSIAADQPFRFPATFTFVVRAFSGIIVELVILFPRVGSFNFTHSRAICAVLDGIGKGLDPRFDITEIAKP